MTTVALMPPADHRTADTHVASVGGDQITRPTNEDAVPGSVSSAGSSSPPAAATRPSMPSTSPLRLADPTLALAADVLDDLERTRIANENRLRQLTRDEADADGELRGFGLTEDHPDVARLAVIVGGLRRLEHDAELNLKRALRQHPLGSWVRSTAGVGEKQGARLLAAVEDPYWHPETLNEDGSVRHKEGPRTVSQLWAYAGLHVLPVGQSARDAHTLPADRGHLPAGQGSHDALHPPAGRSKSPADHSGRDAHSFSVGGDQIGSHPDRGEADAHVRCVGVAAKRRKGQKANWNAIAKTRAYLVAESCMKCRQSPYRAVYDHRREHTAQTHPEWTLGHSHNDALRVVAKAVLRDLWREARRLHEEAA